MKEALKLALEALENISTALREDDVLGSDIELMLNTIGKIHAALAQPERDPWREALAQPEERNFCPRCGKRLGLGGIHTCTPPKDAR